MKNNKKNILKNAVITFTICFILFVNQAYSDYNYYKVYPKEELVEFFSMTETLLLIFEQSLLMSIRQTIIFVPILAILEKTKINNIMKIIITVVLTFSISFMFVLLSYRNTF